MEEEVEIPWWEIQVNLINKCTDLSPEYWIRIYAAKFRDIIDRNPNYTEYQIAHELYLWK